MRLTWSGCEWGCALLGCRPEPILETQRATISATGANAFARARAALYPSGLLTCPVRQRDRNCDHLVDRRDPGSHFPGVAERFGALPPQFPFNAYGAPTPARGAGSYQTSQSRSGGFCYLMPETSSPRSVPVPSSPPASARSARPFKSESPARMSPIVKMLWGVRRERWHPWRRSRTDGAPHGKARRSQPIPRPLRAEQHARRRYRDEPVKLARRRDCAGT